MVGTRQSSRKPLKVSDGDHLSSLPDAIICHILSFLPTKLSVSTSILAKRWRLLWAHVLNLEFDSENYHSDTSFSSIINRVMLLRKAQSINTFRLYCYEFDCSTYELETWISTAIERNVQNIDLDLHPENIENIYALPRCLFTCRTLVDLRLCLCTFPPFSGTISLPSLKKLHLYHVEYVVDEALPHLLSCCPVLDEFSIEEFVVDNCYNISSPTIRRLTVDFPNNGQDFSRDYMVEINAPALKYLELKDYVATHISAHMLTSLIEADIYFDCFSQVGDDYYFLSVLRFVDSLCNVKYLKLSIGQVVRDRTLSISCRDLLTFAIILSASLVLINADSGQFSCEIKSIISFDNCTRLELAADWLFLVKFLESAENLEVVIIREVCAYLKYWMEPKQVPTCVLSHLGTVRIDEFDCTEPEFQMVRYFLMNAKVLKRMEIHSKCNGNGIDLNEKIEALRRISLFKRGSEACELAFY